MSQNKLHIKLHTNIIKLKMSLINRSNMLPSGIASLDKLDSFRSIGIRCGGISCRWAVPHWACQSLQAY